MKLIESKGAAWAAFVLVITFLILQFCLGPEPWWTFLGVFMAFMMTFFHLLATYMSRARAISRQLDFWAMIFGVLTVVSIIGIYIAESAIYDL